MDRRLVIAFGLAACGDNRAAPPDAAPAPDAPIDASDLPVHLSETGLCADPACTEINPGIVEYVPNVALWADTASKRRWVYLPAGTQIDTTDMNHWMFPQGFKAWKEFTRDGVRVETRLIEKVGPGDTVDDWLYMPFQWNLAQDDAVAVPLGVMGANGTMHNIPGVMLCRTCHEALAPSRILGIQAIQLDGAAPVGIDELAAMGVLSAPPTGTSPHFPIPGANATEKSALAYLHANCGHCHNPLSSVTSETPLKLRLDVDHMATTADTDTFKTGVDKAARKPFDDGGMHYSIIIVSGDSASSALFDRFITTDPGLHMPGAGSVLTDPDARLTLQTWIDSL